MFKSILSFLFVFNFCLLGQNNSQDRFGNSIHGQKRISLEQKPGHFYTTFTTKDGNVKVNDIDLTEEMDVIVEFKDEPLFLKQKQQKFFKAGAESYQAQHAQFSIDLSKISRNLSQQFGVNFKSPEIKRTYYKLFNGASLGVARAVLSGISSLNYVKKIHLDKIVKADLRESVPLIKADSVWYQFGTQGDSIVVGIIDCGIDYNHPALGKGFGKGHKVIGGWNFVKNNNDPMDDNGHGTHVAGIIAGNSDSIKGVAPKALLMAFKVLDANGFGTESNVIAGIERATDPNNDDNYNDKVDVVNMSLGNSGGDPDDAMSTAVDNAVKIGTIFCIAAGNDGFFGFSTIGSPGTSRLAITVGASDKSDKIADFSSKGPNNNIYSIKPDILAPGVNIYSSLLHETYGKYDGTSMAAPHVAGVCALLKKIHPSWGPEEIKSILMITAKNIGEETMAQGAGRIDALSAAKISTLSIPSTLSFGLDDLKQTIWHKSDILLIKNGSKETQKYDISFTGLRSGISLSVDPQNFSLSPGDSLPVKFNLQVDNNVTPNPSDTTRRSSSTFSGNININSSIDKLHIPWAFVKSAKVLLRFDEPIFDYYLINDKQQYFDIAGVRGNKIEFLIQPGKYDLFVSAFEHDSAFYSPSTYRWKFNIKENILIGINDTIEVKMADAKNIIKCRAKDNNGNDMLMTPGTNQVFGYSFDLPYYHFSCAVNFSFDMMTTSFSDRIQFYPWGYFANLTNNKAWLLDFGIPNGINGSTNFTNDYTKFIEQKFTMYIPAQVNQPDVRITTNDIAHFLGTNDYFYFITSIGSFKIINGKCSGTLYVMPLNDTKSSRQALGLGLISGAYNPYYYYDPFTVFNDSIGLHVREMPTKNIYCSGIGQEFTLNNGLIYTDNYHRNNMKDSIGIYTSPSFFGSMNEYRNFDLTNTIGYIYDVNNILVKKDTLKDFGQFISVPPGKYRTEITNSNYYIQKQQGNAKLVSKYNLALKDPNPPMISSLQIRNSKGIPSDKLEKNEKAMLLLSAFDLQFFYKPVYSILFNPVLDDSTSIYVKEFGTKFWNKIQENKISEDTLIGCYYSADLSKYTNHDSTALDIKIVLYDKSGNSLDYTLEPAIAIGKFGGTLTNINDEGKITVIPGEYKLYNNYPNPFNPSTTINYSLPEKAKVTIEIFNILGQKTVTLFEGIEEAGNYKRTWDAKNYSSGIYLCRLKAEGSRSFEKNQKLILMK